MDKVRQQVISSKDVGPLDYFDEAFTSENWLVRIYKVKGDEPEGRTWREVGDFERKHANNNKRRQIAKPELDLRV